MIRSCSTLQARCWGAALGLLLAMNSVLGCRYNVRDLGFIDVGDQPYLLHVYPADAVGVEKETALSKVIAEALADSNVLVPPISQSDELVLRQQKLLAAHEELLPPAMILESPDGQSWPIPLDLAAANWEGVVREQLEALVESPLRTLIRERAAEAFGVVLMLEGEDHEANKRARQAISEAIERIGEQMAWMPKAIARPPECLVLDRATQKVEQVLLWSLSLGMDVVREPCAFVIYGHARWMGPIARGAEISEQNMARLLSIIGADCECGMDISWTRGTRLPIRWGESIYRSVAQSLGFDPENPMVKMEASRILNRFGGLGGGGSFLGYEETSLDNVRTDPNPGTDISAGEGAALSTEGPDVSAVAVPAANGAMDQGMGTGRGDSDADSRPEQTGLSWFAVLAVFSGLGGLVVLGGGIILWRAYRQGRFR